jgi:hypothetical protein
MPFLPRGFSVAIVVGILPGPKVWLITLLKEMRFESFKVSPDFSSA